MLGDRPPLSPPELVYQRMLAGDPMEAAEQAQNYLKEKPLIAYYEEVLVEGLKLAQADARSGLLADERMERIRDAVAEIIDDLSSHEDKPEQASKVEDAETASPLAQINQTEASLNQKAAELPAQWRTAKPVLCIPGLSVLDEAVALMVAQLVEKQGIGARVEKADALSVSRIFSLDTKDVALVCICYVENATAAQIQYAIRRLRRKAPQAIILVALIGNTNNVTDADDKQPIVFDHVERTLSGTVDKILAAASGLDDKATRSLLPKAG